MPDRKRKAPTPRERLRVFQRDCYRCTICGANPVTTPGIVLHVDHVEPFGKGGADDESNFQTLCQKCNQGKGDVAELNKPFEVDILNLLFQINPQILESIASSGSATVVANVDDFVQLQKKNGITETFEIQALSNTIIGYKAGYGMGIYTLVDNHGQKVNFILRHRRDPDEGHLSSP